MAKYKRIKKAAETVKTSDINDIDLNDIDNEEKNYRGQIKHLINKYNSQCSVNILESKARGLSYWNKFQDASVAKNEKDANVIMRINNILERSDFYTQLRKYGKHLAEDGVIYITLWKIMGNWFLKFSKESDVVAKKIFRYYTEIHFLNGDVDKNDNPIWIKQWIGSRVNPLNKQKEQVIWQNKFIRNADGEFIETNKKERVAINNLEFIPTGIIRNNSDSAGDADNIQWLIEKLDHYWTLIDKAFYHTKTVVAADSSSARGAETKRFAFLRGKGKDVVMPTSPSGDNISNYVEPPQQPLQTLIGMVDWFEDKIIKFMSGIREKNIMDKQQKNNLEIVALDQISIEYYLHKKQQREEDLTFFFNEILLPIFNLELGTKIESLGYFVFDISEFQKAKMEAIKSAMVKNQNLQAQSEQYYSTVRKTEVEIEQMQQNKETEIKK